MIDVQEALDRRADEWGPMNCMVVMTTPLTSDPLVRVERYGTLVVVRYRWRSGPDVVRELPQSGEAHALREYARQVSLVQGRGYAVTGTLVTR